MVPNYVVPEEEYANAEEFLSALDIARDDWAPNSAWESPWIFRGQGDAAWSLTPKAWREADTPELQRLAVLKRRAWQDNRQNILIRFERSGYEITANNELDFLELFGQARAEFQIIYEFLELADKLGHPVPGAGLYRRLVHHDWLPDISEHLTMHLLPDPNPATALAQHHGIPTRLLDWTHNPLVAAYFAAEQATPHVGEQKLTVWAIQAELLSTYLGDNIQIREACQFKLLEAPRSENSFLNAQEGLFLYPIRADVYRLRNNEWPHLEHFAIDVLSLCGETTIRKLTLPTAHAKHLLRKLWLKGVSRGHLMPTYENVTKSLQTKWTWTDY